MDFRQLVRTSPTSTSVDMRQIGVRDETRRRRLRDLRPGLCCTRFGGQFGPSPSAWPRSRTCR
ncbi:MAG: hypothetical protein ACLTKG_03795 [Collinsella intestinalis]